MTHFTSEKGLVFTPEQHSSETRTGRTRASGRNSIWGVGYNLDHNLDHNCTPSLKHHLEGLRHTKRAGWTPGVSAGLHSVCANVS